MIKYNKFGIQPFRYIISKDYKIFDIKINRYIPVKRYYNSYWAWVNMYNGYRRFNISKNIDELFKEKVDIMSRNLNLKKMIKENPFNIIPNRYVIDEYGGLYNLKTCNIIKPSLVYEYYRYTLYDNNGNHINYLVHRLVAMMFCINHWNDYSLVVNHIDGNKRNNHYTNLEWCTIQHNSEHAVLNGLVPRKYTNELLISICELLEKGYKNIEIINKLNLGISNSTNSLINHIKHRDSYLYISKNYNW